MCSMLSGNNCSQILSEDRIKKQINYMYLDYLPIETEVPAHICCLSFQSVFLPFHICNSRKIIDS